jgi:hypothetical protein
LAFFNSRCAVPGFITSRDQDVHHLCGFDALPVSAWRGIKGTIEMLPHISLIPLILGATDMDGCKTIADIEAKLHRPP